MRAGVRVRSRCPHRPSGDRPRCRRLYRGVPRRPTGGADLGWTGRPGPRADVDRAHPDADRVDHQGSGDRCPARSGRPGLIDLDEPVATYWPAFGQCGKADIPVRLVLSHRSGLAALDAAVSNDQAADLDPVLRQIERQKLWWRPGSKHGYHAVTFGFIVSGLVRAVTGRTVGQYFAEQIAPSLDLDLHIGLPVAQHDRVAAMIGPSQRQAIRAMLNPVCVPYALALLNRRSASYRATFGGSSVGFDDHDELIRYDVEDPSAGGVGTGSTASTDQPTSDERGSAIPGRWSRRGASDAYRLGTGILLCRVDPCGQTSAYRGCSATPVPADPWPSPTRNITSPSVTPRTSGPS